MLGPPVWSIVSAKVCDSIFSQIALIIAVFGGYKRYIATTPIAITSNGYVVSNTHNEDLNMELFEISLSFASICTVRSVRFLGRVYVRVSTSLLVLIP